MILLLQWIGNWTKDLVVIELGGGGGGGGGLAKLGPFLVVILIHIVQDMSALVEG